MNNSAKYQAVRGQSHLERMLLHIVQGITVIGIAGGWVSLSELKTSNAVLQTKVESLRVRMDDLFGVVST